jgi:hypothetical protein
LPGGGTAGRDGYEHPTPQVITMRGTSCVETISLPLMQQYYTNTQIANQDYAFFKLSYVDFPLNDSLRKTVGKSSIALTVHVEVRYTNSTLSVHQSGPDPDIDIVRTQSIDV